MSLGTNHYYSVRNKLIKNNLLNKDIERIINSLSLEEIISLKLELSSRTSKGKVYGFKIWHNLRSIVEEAIVLHTLSICKSLNESRNYLGLSTSSWTKVLKKYNPNKYFNN